MTLVCDTSVVYAALDKEDSAHRQCARALRETREAIVLPSPVVVETDWLSMARGKSGALDALLGSIEDGTVLVAQLDLEDYSRIRALMTRYSDLPLDLVDASVVAVAERLEETTIATLDHRHFSVVRPLHAEAFTLVP